MSGAAVAEAAKPAEAGAVEPRRREAAGLTAAPS